MKKPVIKDNISARKSLCAYLRKQILSNEAGPGERLVETRIARETGASRTPVREALQDLEREGLVVKTPRTGYVVKPIGEEELEEIFRIRSVLEELAVTWAIEQSRPKLLKELKKIIAVSEEKISKGQSKALVELGPRFHETIAKMTGSPRLLEMTRLMTRHLQRYRLESMYKQESALLATAGHKAILSAIEKGDPEEIRLTLKNHLEESRSNVLRHAFGQSDAKGEKKRFGNKRGQETG